MISDKDIEKFMTDVIEALHHHLKGDAFAECYNRCYEAIGHAIEEYNKEKPIEYNKRIWK